MSGLFFILALFFGGIALWAGIHLFRIHRNPVSQPHRQPQPRVIAPSPTNPWGALMMRKRERDGLRPGQRGL